MVGWLVGFIFILIFSSGTIRSISKNDNKEMVKYIHIYESVVFFHRKRERKKNPNKFQMYALREKKMYSPFWSMRLIHFFPLSKKKSSFDSVFLFFLLYTAILFHQFSIFHFFFVGRCLVREFFFHESEIFFFYSHSSVII